MIVLLPLRLHSMQSAAFRSLSLMMTAPFATLFWFYKQRNLVQTASENGSAAQGTWGCWVKAVFILMVILEDKIKL